MLTSKDITNCTERQAHPGRHQTRTCQADFGQPIGVDASHQQVGWLDVPVRHAVAVARQQRHQQLLRDVGGLTLRQRPTPRQVVR